MQQKTELLELTELTLTVKHPDEWQKKRICQLRKKLFPATNEHAPSYNLIAWLVVFPDASEKMYRTINDLRKDLGVSPGVVYVHLNTDVPVKQGLAKGLKFYQVRS